MKTVRFYKMRSAWAALIFALLIAETAVGQLYWTDNLGGRIVTANRDGTGETTLISGLLNPSGIAIDAVNGKVYWTEWNGSVNISRANLDGTGIEPLVTGHTTANEIDLDLDNGHMYWTEWNGRNVLQANLDGSGIVTLITGALGAEGIALDVASGHMYLGSEDGGVSISRADLDGSNHIPIVAGFTFPTVRGVKLDLVNGKVYWASLSPDSSIVRANLDGTGVEAVVSAPGNNWDVALDPGADEMFSTYFSGGNIYRSELDGSNLEALNLGGSGNFFIDLLVYDPDGDGVRVGDDLCPHTAIPEGVPTVKLNPGHWSLSDDNFDFDTVIKGKGVGTGRSYSTADTAGCSCEQIIAALDLGDGHTKHGCSISSMDEWVELVTP